jgi:hypothetical protein
LLHPRGRRRLVGPPRFEPGTSCTPNRPAKIGQEVWFPLLVKKSLALALLNLVEPCWSLVRSPLQNHLQFRTIYSELFGPLAYVR